ncbi:CD302 antigen [Pelobates fuscus]|uniref:CD302 antigen n=1 Tax=Pelobates fuscus TaxID=191477 RepID=UPI002FE4903E
MTSGLLLTLLSALCWAERSLGSRVNSDECPFPAWVYYNNNCYSFLHTASDSLLNIERAQELCKDLGSNIISINTQEENNFILHMFQTEWKGPNGILLGLFYDSDDDTLKWLDTSEFTYTNFKEEQTDMGLITCAKMDTSTGQWDLISCEDFNQAGTLCKTKASKQRAPKQADQRVLPIALIMSITLLVPLLSAALLVLYKRTLFGFTRNVASSLQVTPYSDEIGLVGGIEEDSA